MKQYAKYTEVKEKKKKKKNIHSSFSVGRPCHRDAELQSAKLYLRINPSLPPPGGKNFNYDTDFHPYISRSLCDLLAYKIHPFPLSMFTNARYLCKLGIRVYTYPGER